MDEFKYIKDFENLGFGVFVHFGLYSIVQKGEWYKGVYGVSDEEYVKLKDKFKVKKNWAKELVSIAKKSGAKYINLVTRHHDGFSLFDTCGLNDFDAPHSACGRDLVKEFVDECNRQGIVPFLYHTLLDWYNEDFDNNFPKYLEYLRKSIEILCTKYGKIGGFWFDGMWIKPNDDWEEDALYGVIRKYQPEAIIVNNTGLSAQGQTGHKEIDCVTFERGKPMFVDKSQKPICGEVCQSLNDHWGEANDYNYKSLGEIIKTLVDCRITGCNLLLNLVITKDGTVKPIDREIFNLLGKWIKMNKDFIYKVKPVEDVTAEGADIVSDGKYYYAIIKDVPMSADLHVALCSGLDKTVTINTDKKVVRAKWLDNGQRIKVKKNTFAIQPFAYGNSGVVRVLKFELV